MSDEAFTISEFCKAFKVSKPKYYNLKNEGRGPRETRLGAKVIITRRDAYLWIDAQQNLTGKAAREQAVIDDRLKVNANAAVRRKEVA